MSPLGQPSVYVHISYWLYFFLSATALFVWLLRHLGKKEGPWKSPWSTVDPIILNILLLIYFVICKKINTTCKGITKYSRFSIYSVSVWSQKKGLAVNLVSSKTITSSKQLSSKINCITEYFTSKIIHRLYKYSFHTFRVWSTHDTIILYFFINIFGG